MGIYEREYKGVNFTINTRETRNGWAWHYLLRNRLYESSDRPLPDELLAVSEAEQDAHWRIDSGI